MVLERKLIAQIGRPDRPILEYRFKAQYCHVWSPLEIRAESHTVRGWYSQVVHHSSIERFRNAVKKLEGLEKQVAHHSSKSRHGISGLLITLMTNLEEWGGGAEKFPRLLITTLCNLGAVEMTVAISRLLTVSGFLSSLREQP